MLGRRPLGSAPLASYRVFQTFIVVAEIVDFRLTYAEQVGFGFVCDEGASFTMSYGGDENFQRTQIDATAFIRTHADPSPFWYVLE